MDLNREGSENASVADVAAAVHALATLSASSPERSDSSVCSCETC